MELPINQIVCGDCLEVMKGWPDGCVQRNPKYVEMARTTRLVPVDTGVPVKEAKAGQLPLFG